MQKLSADLVPIYELELANGNEVLRIDEPAGSRCPYCIVFRYPLHKSKIEQSIALPPSVQYWESRDQHYPVEGGYVSEESRHVVSGPLP